KFPLPDEVDISGKKILVVDDVADTGETYSVIMEYLLKKDPSEVKTAVLQYKTRSCFIPDFWGKKLEKWEWIIYPWARYEDLRGFIERSTTLPLSFDELRRKLKDDFNLNISKKDLAEILEDMQELGELTKIKIGKQILWVKPARGKSE
ncbi:MAG: phosphoribosyltransferase, partial [Candidatus Methanoperedens sp.]|nr:phosphoribosyltransferase [Candidatus Methanoperedens sp.]